MFKWRMNSKESAYRIKKAIQDEADILDFISVATAKQIAYTIPTIEPMDYEDGWRWSDLRGNNIFVRSLKDGSVWLYICEPTINIKKLTVDPEKNIAIIDPENKAILEGNPDGIRIEIPSEEAKDKAVLDHIFENLKEILAHNCNGRLKCMVWKKSKKKDVVVEEWPCWFHCWHSNRIVKNDGTTVDQLLAVCEYQDGHVERINFDHIRFVEEWD